MRLPRAGRLDTKILCFVFAVIFLPISIIYGFVLQSYVQGRIGLENQSIQDYLTRMYYGIQSNCDLAQMSTQVVMTDGTLVSLMDKQDAGLEITIDDMLQIKRKTVETMKSLIASSPPIYALRFYAQGEQGEIPPFFYGMARLDASLVTASREGRQEQWVFGTPSVTRYEGERVSRYVSYYRRMTAPSGALYGLVETTLLMEDFLGGMARATTDTLTGYISDSGALYYTYASENAFDEAPWSRYIHALSQHMLKEGDTPRIVTLEGDRHVLVHMLPIPQLTGRIFRVVNLDGVMRDIRSMLTAYLLLLAVLLALLAIVIRGGVRKLLGNMVALVDTMRQVGEGNMQATLPAPQNDETGELVTHFRRMLTQIELLMKANEQKQIVARDSEIHALQNQINTHFLYNTLETIRMMAEMEAKIEIADALTSLGMLFRYSMHWTGSTVTVRDELAHIESYVMLLRLRHDFRIDIVCDIPDELYPQEITKLCLQPLVENAVKHGARPIGKDLTLTITGTVEPDAHRFILTLEDNGAGMPEDALETLRAKMNGPLYNGEGSQAESIGMRNVQNRIRIQFGEAYGIHVDSRQGAYTRVRIMLPYQKL